MASPDAGVTTGLWVAKAIGAVAGSAISLAYVLPHGRREAAIRFLSGVAGGMVFGMTVGVHIARELGIDETLSQAEIAIMGAGVASLSLWWAIGLMLRWSGAPKQSNKPEADNER